MRICPYYRIIFERLFLGQTGYETRPRGRVSAALFRNLREEPGMVQVSRYHPLLVALHWALAVLIMAALALGALVMVKIANSDPMNLEALRSHMTGGVLILLLMPYLRGP